MKIRAFAHATFTAKNSLTDYPVIVDTELENFRWKQSKMKKSSDFQKLTIVDAPIRSEFIEYFGSEPVFVDVSKYYNFRNREITSSSFSIEILNNLIRLGAQPHPFRTDAILVNDTFPKSKLTICQDLNGIHFEENMDSPGLTSIAFFVDKIDISYLGKVFSKCELSEVSSLNIGGKSLNICFLEFQRARIEFIERI